MKQHYTLKQKEDKMKHKLLLLSIIFLATLTSCKNIQNKNLNSKSQGENMEKLLTPNELKEKAPDHFKVKFNTTKGSFVVEVKREWAPNGVDRFYNLVKNGFYNNTAFFRVIKDFVAQFGINGNPEISKIWMNETIIDDPVKLSNKRGTLTFATRGPNTRTTQLFINYKDNSRLDSMGFSPIGIIIEGMETIDNLYSEYGEGEPYGNGPSQTKIYHEGNDYLKKNFPKLDYIISAEIF